MKYVDHETQPDIHFTHFWVILDVSLSLVHACGLTLCNFMKPAYSPLFVLPQKVDEWVQIQYVALPFFFVTEKAVVFCKQINNCSMKRFCIWDLLYYSQHSQVDIRSALAKTKTFPRMSSFLHLSFLRTFKQFSPPSRNYSLKI